ncbi:suppressor of deletion of TFIIS [Coemansia sp. RSA 1365]|nr:suppressor of deletion of TFIIS [Coemansia sp. RSA 1365]
MDSTQHNRVFFFDIDNCLYPPNLGIMHLMKERIYAFGRESGLDEASVVNTCETYLRDYGLSVRGLIMHHKIDPAEFNAKVDGSIPLEDFIKPDAELRTMLQTIKVRRWAFTNAGKDHAYRVLKCLAVGDLFEGVTYCDYMEPDFPCKPERAAYYRAMKDAGVSDAQKCYFADDSTKNVETARQIGWTAVRVWPSIDDALTEGSIPQIKKIHQLPEVLPQLFS